MCGAGPFKESEKNYKYLAIGDKNANNYCLSCIQKLNLSKEGFIDNKSNVEKEVVSEVFYSSMSTVKTPAIGFDYGVSDEETPTPRKIKSKIGPASHLAKKVKSKSPKAPLTPEKVKEIVQQLPPLFGEEENIDISLIQSNDAIDDSLLVTQEDYLEEDELFPPSSVEEIQEEEIVSSPLVEEEKSFVPSIVEEIPPSLPVEEIVEEIREESPSQPLVEETVEESPPQPSVEKTVEESPLPTPINETTLPTSIEEESPQLIIQKIPEETMELTPPPFLLKKGKDGILAPPIKEEDKEDKGPFSVYIGQFADNTFTVNMAKDINEDIKIINSCTTRKSKKLPIEIVFYTTDEVKKDAIKTLKAIRSMSVIQKEILVRTFSQNFFKK
jgi:hypothetical protein